MEYRDDARLDQSQIEYAGGGSSPRRGGGIALGGGAGLVVLLIALFFGLNPGDLLGSQTPASTAQPASTPSCATGADIAKNRECRWVAYVNSIQSYWGQAMQGYRPAKMVIFSNAVSTGCGTASSQVGPFYCPPDEKVYLDPVFADQLLKQLGAQGGDAAEAYIIAHEYGHHISNLTGTLGKAQTAGGQQTGPKSAQTRLELQADCYAGVWFANTLKDPNSAIKTVTADDLNRIVDAAKSVGDDHIQMQSTGGISPESWTHGSSAMRKYWVQKGFSSGNPNVCDTFSTDNLGG